MPNYVVNRWEYYDAPKNGGTTVRLWIKYALGELPADFRAEGYYTLSGIGLPSGWTDTVMGPHPFFYPGEEGNSRWCIVRDPVERFVSAYSDKVLRESLAPWTVETCLDMQESGEMERLACSAKATPLRQAARHFLGQAAWFGGDKGYFDNVFRIGEMGRVREFCEDVVFKKPLPAFHGRRQSNSGIKKIRLSERQIARLERIYLKDYHAGWC